MTTNHFSLHVPIELIHESEIPILRDEFGVTVYTGDKYHEVKGSHSNPQAEAIFHCLSQRIEKQSIKNIIK